MAEKTPINTPAIGAQTNASTKPLSHEAKELGCRITALDSNVKKLESRMAQCKDDAKNGSKDERILKLDIQRLASYGSVEVSNDNTGEQQPDSDAHDREFDAKVVGGDDKEPKDNSASDEEK